MSAEPEIIAKIEQRRSTPLDELAQYVGPDGPGSKKPCPDSGKEMGCVNGVELGYRSFQDQPHSLCQGTGFVLDPEAPLFRALWEPCPAKQLGSEYYATDCKGYHRHPRAEVALMLPEAIAQLYARSYGGIKIEFSHYKYPGSAFFVCELRMQEGASSYWMADARASSWLDALAAAVLKVWDCSWGHEEGQ